MKKNHEGFTVLELLIVIGIMAILMSLILVGLQSARSHSRDEDKVTNVQTIVVGITQFYDACRSYPAALDSATLTSNPPTCSSLNGKTILDFIPDLASYNFNGSGSDYMYTALTADSNNASDCTNFHISVNLEGDASSFSSVKSGFLLTHYNSDPQNVTRQLSVCGTGTTDPIDGTQSSVFDIKK